MARKAGRQATPEQFFDTALRILASDGYPALKIGGLCAAIDVTSGSFYHHFDGWPAFVEALLEYWETEQSVRINDLTRMSPDPVERIALTKHLALTLPHEAEAALRAWRRLDPRVDEVVARVDAERTRSLADVIAGVVPDPEAAHRLAVLGMSIMVGHAQLRATVDTDELLALFDEFETLIRLHVGLPQLG